VSRVDEFCPAPVGFLADTGGQSLFEVKKALLTSADKPSVLITTPPDPPLKAVQTFRIDAKLSDTGTLQGKIERTAEGDDSEVVLRALFRRRSVRTVGGSATGSVNVRLTITSHPDAVAWLNSRDSFWTNSQEAR